MKRLTALILASMLFISSVSNVKAETNVELPIVYHSIRTTNHLYSFIFTGNPDAQIIHFNYDYTGDDAADFDGYYLDPNNHQFNFEFVRPGILTIRVSEGQLSFVISYKLVEVPNVLVPMVSK